MPVTEDASFTPGSGETIRRKFRDRQALGPGDFTDADIAALEATRAPESSRAFDAELS